ncbi:hypothetical protein BH11PSE4_BH11PSE4_30700 [soil metagenome]
MFDHLIIDIIGLSLLGLCIAVLAAPGRRPPTGFARD